jgi:CrcB protein
MAIVLPAIRANRSPGTFLSRVLKGGIEFTGHCTSYLIVALGSAIGGALRHGVNVSAARWLGAGWPGTLAVNVTGSFVMGVIVAYFALKGHAPQRWLLFLTTGVLGGYTTFSTFSLDVALLYKRGQLGLVALYLAASVVMSVSALFLGLAVVRQLAP